MAPPSVCNEPRLRARRFQPPAAVLEAERGENDVAIDGRDAHFYDDRISGGVDDQDVVVPDASCVQPGR
jgi:hypothetical protein